jgi:hypothetical protein
MESHEIVGSVTHGEKDTESVRIGMEIENDGLPDDPRLYFAFDDGGEHIMVAFPLKEVFRAIEKGLLG